MPTPAQWQNATVGDTLSDRAYLAHWWKKFQDPLLDELVLRALGANRDLKIAAARVREARSLVTVAQSVLFPTLDANVNGGRQKRIERVIPVPGPQGVDLVVPRADAVSGELSLAWEIDVFGGNRLEAQAAAQALGAEEGRRAVQVGLLAQVATSYLDLRGAQRQTAILRENIAVQRERLRLLQSFFRAGLATELDIARQQTLVRTTEGTLPVLTHLTAMLIHRLGVLLGEPPHTLEAQLSKVAPLPPALPHLPGLLPSDLLQQRPDLRRAQAEVTAAAASLGAARAELFPKFFISLSGGLGALSLVGLPSVAGQGIYALGSGITAPIFNAGRIRANITAADARLARVAASYEKTFLTALEEVENAYVAYTTARQRREDLRQAVDAAGRAYRVADAFYRRGVTDFLSVLDAQRAKLSAEDEQSKAETAVTVAMVTLYRAFGGGWDSHEQGISSIPQLYSNPKLNLNVRLRENETSRPSAT
ncbi:MAG: efflux transporter outer membrane subunit [Gammaproteobacteria bacterium]